ncbi:MAG: hypothetical protein Q8N26_15325, partial [Myxococcales bacterium]|nr:hypothetical protein [Myxococcales bacterium]
SAAGGSAVGGGAGGGSGTCDGCVLANGTCQPRGTTRQNNNVCGSGGQLCQSCLSPTPACDNGVCVAPPLRVGDACVLDAQCQSSIGPTARCKQQNLNGAIVYSGGHCTVFDCAATGLDACPLGSVCLILPRIYSEEQSQCFASGCGAAAPCRPGYSCFNLGTNVTGCLPTAINDLNLVLDTTSVVGGACTLNSQCRAPVPGAPFAGGACITEFVSRADGGLVLGSDGGPQPTGNPGGYCSRFCRIDEDCTSTGGEDLAEGLCLGVSQTSALCFRGCASPRGGQSNCRPSYVCERLLTSDGGVLPTGYCEGRCDVPGGACGNYADGGARPCLSTGYCLF